MTAPLTVFEISWEVANKVGGIHTVLSTKAKSMVERLGDRYVCIGPWRLADPRREPTFADEGGFEGFSESCRSLGIPVRVGRWLVPGTPRAILVDSSALYRMRDDLLARLWDHFRVDSLYGAWDYVEPVLFGHAAGAVVERWWQEHVSPSGGEAILHAHDWLAGAALLHARERLPSVGTVWTTHATSLGRALAATGLSPTEGLAGRTPDEAAESLGARSKHSMETVCARETDVLSTVSDLLADEVRLLLGRRPDAVLVNGMDVDAYDAVSRASATDPRGGASAALRRLARAFFDLDETTAARLTIVATAGRNEMRNKGYDVLLDALGRVDRRPGPPVLAFFFVPVGVSHVRRDLAERLAGGPDAAVTGRGPLAGVATHALLDGDPDLVGAGCAAAGLDNGGARRVRVLHVADYVAPRDGLLDMPYEATIGGVDLACFPSFYEPWGYTPIEALAAGVPTITTDLAGFGRWARARGLGPADGVTVLARRGRDDASAAEDLAATIDRVAAGDATLRASAQQCRAAIAALAWSRALEPQDRAYDAARRRARDRALGAAASFETLTRGSVVSDAAADVAAGGDEVARALPEPLRGLVRLSRNLRWTWDPDAPSVFAAVGGDAWDACRHNPVVLLADAPAADLSQEASDAALAARLRDAVARVEADCAETGDGLRVPATLLPSPPPMPERSPWPPLPEDDDGPALSPSRPVAYFCAEFGVHESLPVYNGGLGVLAGDQLKAAHDERLPLVGVGLFYRRGFLRQHVSAAGEQIPLPVENVPRDLPVELVRDAEGGPLRVEIDLPGTRLVLVAWKAAVGRVPLFLLDADVPENRAEDRAVTHRLYAGDAEMRLRQEIVLGKGGVRLLARLGIEPSVVHLNEGHAAFAPLERVSRLVHDARLSFDEAAAVVRSTTVFTTHTPIPAGHDRFPEPLLRRYFADSVSWIGLRWDRFLALGRAGSDAEFNMTYLGLRMSSSHNGVSRLHGSASRRLLAPVWPSLVEDEMPVGHVTNGVHLPTWTAPAVARLVAAPPAGAASLRPVTGDDFASRAATLDLAALWAARRAAKAAMLASVRERVHAACAERREPQAVETRVIGALRDDALYVGFARRFATYKRADLLLRDVHRLVSIVSQDDRPVRLLFAGKAHPADRAGQDVLRRVVVASRRDDLLGRIVLLEDYDVALARVLVQGVDVWLNTPVRPLEASGTSGMKAACNGALHCSIRDGWWDEAYDAGGGATPPNGFSIGGADGGASDDVDASALYRLLEDEVVPLFFERDGDGVPRRWLERVRRSLATIPPVFDARRMVRQYAEQAYRPLAEAGAALSRRGFESARSVAASQADVRHAFSSVRVTRREPESIEGKRAGESVDVVATVDLAGLAPARVIVDVVLTRPGTPAIGGRVGAVLAPDETGSPAGSESASVSSPPTTYRGRATAGDDGRTSLTIRVRPRADGPAGAALADLVVWG